MKPVPFLAALLVIVAMTMPWFTPGSKEPGIQMFGVASVGEHSDNKDSAGLSFIDVARNVYLNRDVLNQNLRLEEKGGVPGMLLSFIAFPLIIIGAVTGLFKGKFGHGIGLVGMVILTLALVYGNGRSTGSLRIGSGYLLAWVGFSVGLVSSAFQK
ncbi:hypothetical protein A3L09_03640 [Thermococcus profundus]|uniref:Uncharacterized protein n=1 Tax=Thermococcus profundus TaxID=49899 RepID=A0A2Z2M811_THEPR|nr:LuxR family transcriptional regulator [Thermococcus profundus]ASJ02407.1 hypothetical protein A3L09_03640 [Thermococcus profundus]